jgi:hypothetical protein
MPLLIQYLVKLFISLSVVWLFYQFVLRKLTFYNSNRWYLLGYTLLSFLIPFVNITPALQNNQFDGNGIVQLIPLVDKYTIALDGASDGIIPAWSATYDKWDWITLGLMVGAGILLIRFIIRCISFFRMRRKAKLISTDGIKVYQVNDHIMPFSFGNAVFINSDLHTEVELQEIIRHEFVHVKQKHTLDILWSEWLCIINWYNPFAWLLKASIRQNLEFIADSKVLENGVSKKQYQYLLLKVIGNNQFSIAPKFNFSSLKKRIAMMNKLKSARMHLVRFLFILPLLAVILLSFRKQIGDQLPGKQKNTANIKDGLRAAGHGGEWNRTPLPGPTIGSADFIDSIPRVTTPNDKGYLIDIIDVNGNCTVVVRDRNGKEVDRLSLNKWKERQEYYDNKYGEIPPPPPPVAPVPPVVAIAPEAPKLPDYVKSIHINNDKVLIKLKDGTSENYNLAVPDQKAAFEKKYGKMIDPPVPPTPPTKVHAPTEPGKPVAPPPVVEIPGQHPDANADKITHTGSDFEITDKSAVIKLKTGGIEKYDLTKADQKAAFEKKYGRIISTHVNTSVDMHAVVAINGASGQTVVSPVTASATADVSVIDNSGFIVKGHEDILITITPKTTADQLNQFKEQMKEKGITVIYYNVHHKEGKLVSISGMIKSKDSKSDFSVTDFNKVILSMIKDSERTYFKVNVKDSETI